MESAQHVGHPVGLVVPIKPLAIAKSRLRSASASDAGLDDHMALVLAMALDTVAAACAAVGVTKVIAVSSDQRVIRALRREGVESMREPGVIGLNAALVMGEQELRARSSTMQIGALNADLPSLRPAELVAALQASAGRRAYCSDRHGTGTTCLVAAVGEDLNPQFGARSASAHASSGAFRLRGQWPSLMHDVDTRADLDAAASLGLGSRTRSLHAPPHPRQRRHIAAITPRGAIA